MFIFNYLDSDIKKVFYSELVRELWLTRVFPGWSQKGITGTILDSNKQVVGWISSETL